MAITGKTIGQRDAEACSQHGPMNAVTLGDSVLNTRTRGITAAIEGFFAFMWFGWGQVAAPSWLSVPLGVGSVTGLVVAGTGITVAVRSVGQSTPMRNPVVRHRYNAIVGAEFAVLALGAVLLGRAKLEPWITVWVCAGVGVHFLPLSRVFGDLFLRTLAAAITSVAIAALIVGMATTIAPSTITGPATGACLLIAAVATLGARSHRTEPTPSPSAP